MIGRIQESKFTQSLVAGALNQSYSYGEDGIINAVYIKSTVPITEAITITRVSLQGSQYDTVCDAKTMNAESNYIFHPVWALFLAKGDSIQIQCTNANVTGSVSGLLHFEGGRNGGS